MKFFRFQTFIFSLLSSISAFLASYILALDTYNDLIDYSGAAFVFVLPILVYIVVHDYICRYIVCSARKEQNITDGCYFWNCPHYSCCPYNSNK